METINQDKLFWALVYTKAKEELRAKVNLERQEIETFLPSINIGSLGSNSKEYKTEYLFPRYLFLRLNHRKDWNRINSTRGVNNLVSFGGNVGVVEDSIVNHLINISDENHTIWQQTNLTQFSEGDNVSVKKGILKGMNAILVSRQGKDRVNLLLRTFNKSLIFNTFESDIGMKMNTEKLKL